MQQRDLARRVGVDSTVLGRIESGTRPCRATEAHDIAIALGVDPGVLLGESKAPSPTERLEAAEFHHLRAFSALRRYAGAVADTARALAESGEPATPSGGEPVTDTGELVEYLRRLDADRRPRPIRVPADAVDTVKQALTDMAAAVEVIPDG